MKQSTNYNFNLPDKADQYDLEHWNENTEKTDTLLKQVNDKLNTEITNRTNGDTEAKNLANATGVLDIAKGGTGETTAKGGFIALANSLTDSENPADEERIVFKYANGLNWGTYTFSRFWDYIKNKISSVLGLTASQYDGNSRTTNNIKVYDLADGTDLDYVRTPGQYKIDSGTVKNAPDGITNGFNLEVFYVKSNYVCQRLTMYVTTGDTFVYVRTLMWSSDNVWTEWRRIAYTDSTVAKATKATSDENGNNIANTYATKTEVSNTYATKTEVSNTYATKTEVSNTYATKEDIETSKDSLLKFTSITRVTPPSFASLLGARALYSEDGGLKQIIVALKANKSYNSGNSTFSVSFIYGVYNISGMPTFIGGYCTTVPGDTSRNIALNHYGRSPSTGSSECVHTIEINNAGVEVNDIITVYLNYL